VPTTNKHNEKKKSAYTELNVNVKARGGYADTLRFLNALKVFPKIVAVRTLSIVPKVGGADAKKTDAPILEIDLELRAYAFKEDEPVKKDDENKTAANGGFLGGNS
jgi:Tfp pilus assembly protein PilO